MESVCEAQQHGTQSAGVGMKLMSKGIERSRRAVRSYLFIAPLMWIVVLLASWLLIVEWRMLPELVNATMAVLT
jgi:hypothetical protein